MKYIVLLALLRKINVVLIKCLQDIIHFSIFHADPLTSHILDTVDGVPASNVEGTLLKWLPGSWKVISTR